MKTKIFLAIAAVLVFWPKLPAEAQVAPGFLQDQAGLAAYAKLNPLAKANFDNARNNLFEFAEFATSTYMIGVKTYFINDEINSDGYNKVQVHFYLGADGWLAVYLLKNESLGKIINWRNSAGVGDNLLKIAFDEAIQKTGAIAAGPMQYYDFSRPQASKMALAGDIINKTDVENSDELSILVPGTLSQASYSVIAFNCNRASWYTTMWLYLNNEKVAGRDYVNFLWGDYDLTKFKAGQPNIIRTVRNGGWDCKTGGASIVLYNPI